MQRVKSPLLRWMFIVWYRLDGYVDFIRFGNYTSVIFVFEMDIVNQPTGVRESTHVVIDQSISWMFSFLQYNYKHCPTAMDPLRTVPYDHLQLLIGNGYFT